MPGLAPSGWGSANPTATKRHRTTPVRDRKRVPVPLCRAPAALAPPVTPAVPHAETAYDHGVLGQGAPVSHSVLSPAQKVKGPA